MAGIGFRLQKLISQQKFSSSTRAYLASAAVSTGPWVLMAMGVTFLAGGQLWAGSDSPNREFRVLATHAFAFSQIIAGAIQLVVTRYLADRLYEEDDDALFPSWTSSSLLCALFCMPIGLLAAWNAQLSSLQMILYGLLLALLGVLWNTAGFLSTLRDYSHVLLAYTLGAATCIAMAMIAPTDQMTSWALAGLCLGIGITLTLLLLRLFAEFSLSSRGSWEILGAFRQYFWLLVMGFSYGLGIWIDKFIFWWMDATQVQILPGFFASPIYDAAVFWSLISVIPSYAIFLLHTETDFYSTYRDFFGAISHRRSYREIHQHKTKMAQVILGNARRLLISQGLITACFVLFPVLTPFHLGLGPDNLHIYQILLLSALLQVMFLFVNILLQYLDFIKYSALLTLGYCVINGLLTWVSIAIGGLSWYGYGSFAASLLCLIIAWILLSKVVDQLEYHTFMGPKSRL